MKILVTGSAGFIGSSLCIKLLDTGYKVVGIDNHNDYYDPDLKEKRLARHAKHPNYTHIRMDIEDEKAVQSLFHEHDFDGVVNLAAQAGVRYSIENPHAYVDSNLVGFVNVLEGCRHENIKHLVYSSSSSVYGANETMPFIESDNILACILIVWFTSSIPLAGNPARVSSYDAPFCNYGLNAQGNVFNASDFNDKVITLNNLLGGITSSISLGTTDIDYPTDYGLSGSSANVFVSSSLITQSVSNPGYVGNAGEYYFTEDPFASNPSVTNLNPPSLSDDYKLILNYQYI